MDPVAVAAGTPALNCCGASPRASHGTRPRAAENHPGQQGGQSHRNGTCPEGPAPGGACVNSDPAATRQQCLTSDPNTAGKLHAAIAVQFPCKSSQIKPNQATLPPSRLLHQRVQRCRRQQGASSTTGEPFDAGQPGRNVHRASTNSRYKVRNQPHLVPRLGSKVRCDKGKK